MSQKRAHGAPAPREIPPAVGQAGTKSPVRCSQETTPGGSQVTTGHPSRSGAPFAVLSPGHPRSAGAGPAASPRFAGAPRGATLSVRCREVSPAAENGPRGDPELDTWNPCRRLSQPREGSSPLGAPLRRTRPPTGLDDQAHANRTRRRPANGRQTVLAGYASAERASRKLWTARTSSRSASFRPLSA
jgi:hypothetical protein